MAADSNLGNWINIGLGLMSGALTTLVFVAKAAWGLSNQIKSLQISLLSTSAEIKEEIGQKIDTRAARLEESHRDLEQRVRLVETDVARFAGRAPRHQ